jgi:predicted nucleic acid-binding protein
LILYGDSSALVKRYLREQGSSAVAEWVAEAERIVCCRIGYVEVRRAIALSKAPDLDPLLARFEIDWTATVVIEVDEEVAGDAALLAPRLELRTLDALHLAAALQVASSDLRFACWDRRLWRAARSVGLDVLPETQP